MNVSTGSNANSLASVGVGGPSSKRVSAFSNTFFKYDEIVPLGSRLLYRRSDLAFFDGVPINCHRSRSMSWAKR